MNLQIICPHFAPDVAPTGEVMTAITSELVARGHRAHVITALPWYRHHRIEPGWGGRPLRVERTDWGTIARIHPFPTEKTNIPARALAFGGFTALATATAMAGRPPVDAVLAMSPPLTLGLAGWVAARWRRVPLVFNIQDVFPDVAVELGVLTSPRAIAAASWLERFIYHRADAVTVLSDDLAANVRAKVSTGRRLPSGTRRARSHDAAKVRVIPNFVDTERIRPEHRENSYRRQYGLVGRRVVMYAGNVGFSQSLGLLVDAARDLKHEHDVVFVVNGGGSARTELQRQAADLDNLVFVDMQPKERLPEVLAAADIHVVPLRRGLARSSVPSKLYSILAAGRPVVASVDSGTEVARVVEQAGAGRAVPPEDSAAFTAASRDLLGAPGRREAMGAAGRRFVEGWASPGAVARSYEELFEELVGRRRED